MKIKAEVRPIDISKLRLGDDIEIELISDKETKRIVVRVESFIKEDERCASCGITLKQAFEWNKRLYCLDCQKNKREASSLAKRGKRHNKAFGGFITIGKGKL